MKEVKPNPCIGCGVQCCSQLLVDVCGYDAWRIARGLGVKPTEFLAYAEPHNETPYDFQLDGSGKSYALILNNMVERPDGSLRCIFGLDLPRGQFRCGIYAWRPISCRAYPFVLQEGEVAIKPRALCPEGVWNLDDLDLTSLSEQLGGFEMEFCIYSLVVARWNEQVAQQPPLEKLDFHPFLNYVMDVYEELEKARSEVPSDAWPGIWLMWRESIASGADPLGSVGIESQPPRAWEQWLQDIHRVVEGTVSTGFVTERMKGKERTAEVCCV